MLTGVVVLFDHTDDVSHSNAFIDALRMFFELFIVEVAFGNEEAERPGDNVIGVDVVVDVLRGELVGGETGGRYAGCMRESSSCCC